MWQGWIGRSSNAMLNFRLPNTSNLIAESLYMNKASILSIAILAFCCSTASADENSKWYAGAALGASKGKNLDIDRQVLVNGNPVGLARRQDVEMGNGTTYSVITGYRFSDQWSIQGEWSRKSYSSDSVKTGGTQLRENDVDLKNDAMMVNAIYTLRGWGKIRPYLGLGAGSSHIKLHKQDTLGGADGNAWVFASQALLGAEYDLSREWTIYGQFQYFRSAKFNISAQSSIGPQAKGFREAVHEAGRERQRVQAIKKRRRVCAVFY